MGAIDPDSLELENTYYERLDDLDESLLVESARLTGEEPEGPGLSVAFVLALRTLIESEILPPGAIMLGHTVTWYQPPPRGEVKTTLTVSRVEADPSKRYHRVIFAYRTIQHSRTIIDQQQEVLWPIVD